MEHKIPLGASQKAFKRIPQIKPFFFLFLFIVLWTFFQNKAEASIEIGSHFSALSELDWTSTKLAFKAMYDAGKEFLKKFHEDLEKAHKEVQERLKNLNIISFPEKPNIFQNLGTVQHIDKKYDYIIVGCGAAGCPLARTLSDSGFDVLVLERGSERSNKDTPRAMDIYGAGIAINDPDISQLIVTKEGIRTHVASVMGGGTSINIAIMIEELKEYFEYLEKGDEKSKWDWNLVEKSFSWVSKKTSSPMPQTEPYGKTWMEGLENLGYGNYKEPTKEKKRKKRLNSKIPANSTSSADHSLKLQQGYVWHGMSLFNSTRNFFRHASDVLLGENDGKKRAKNLVIKTRKTVRKVEFDTSGKVPKATCVLYSRTTHEDVQPINRSKPSFADPITKFFEWLIKLKSMFHIEPLSEISGTTKSVCIKDKGEIILSAGAIMTTLLLFKSGLGPKKQIDELQVPLVKEIPSLGQKFSDRVFIPVAAFFAKEPTISKKLFRTTEAIDMYPPRICQSVGIRPFGPGCEDNMAVSERTLNCSLATAEELSGGRISEGVIFSTRYIFPPEWREDPVVDYIFTIFQDCAEGKSPFGNPLFRPICKIANPSVNCFRRVAANYYFTSEPKSRGHIKMKRDGSVIVQANYLKDTQDLFDAIRGVQNLLRTMNGDTYKGVFQKKTLTSCPMMILNNILDLVLNMGFSMRPLLGQLQNFDKIRDHIEDLLPAEGRSLRRLIINDEIVELSEEKLDQNFLNNLKRQGYNIDVLHQEKIINKTVKENKKKEKYTQNYPLSLSSSQKTFFSITQNVIEEDKTNNQISQSVEVKEEKIVKNNGKAKKREEKKICQASPMEKVSKKTKITGSCVQECQPIHFRNYSKTCSQSDICYSLYNNEHCQSGSENPAFPELKSLGEKNLNKEENFELKLESISLDFLKKVEDVEKEISGDPKRKKPESFSKAIREEMTRVHSRIFKVNENQWAATYPPRLPDPDNVVDVAKYALTYMTSVWHHSGTAPMGDVVDDNFKVLGIDGLSIVDASVLKQVTRMNPTATLLMLGRYAGLLKAKMREKSEVQKKFELRLSFAENESLK